MLDSLGPVGIGYAITGVILLGLLREPLRRLDTPGSAAFVITVVGCSLWPVSLAVALTVDGSTATAVAFSGRILAASILSVGWFLLVLDVSNRPRWYRRAAFVLSGYLLLDLAVLATNSTHALAFTAEIALADADLDPAYGRWFWIQATVNYALMTSATALLIVQAIRANGLYRRQTMALALAPIPPAVANVVTLFDVIDVASDLTPFGLLGSVLILSWALYRAKFLSVVPLARKQVFAELRDAIVVIDEHDRIVECNQAALTLFPGDELPQGQQFFDSVAFDELTHFARESAVDTRVTIPTDGGHRDYQLSISPIETGRDGADWRGIVLRDVTDRTRRARQLADRSDHLDEVANVVSHDVQGPLMVIRGSADLAEQTGDVTHVDGVLTGADRIERLADEVVDLARRDRAVDEVESVSLAAVSDLAWTLVGDDGDELVVESDRDVRADGFLFQQLLEGLFRYCLAGTDGNGRVRIGSTEDGFTVEVDTSLVESDSRLGGTDGASERDVSETDGGSVSGTGGTGDESESGVDRVDGTENVEPTGFDIARDVVEAHGWRLERIDRGDETAVRVRGLGESVERR
ncbi:histidine kinase N-terminal 7TM domain-containing protein [Halovivax gelatinilyticus]|uniref:histidine kinase N-terminal 7TM domain-containing protein n=1 Tax=Halovivax gelatinilyticus TaxID=2961597 RepID=UPI0020CA8DC7|nr:histidine kinase N-terminal 7TM domain-containing protein [Halovivax gelatinilyticus]